MALHLTERTDREGALVEESVLVPAHFQGVDEGAGLVRRLGRERACQKSGVWSTPPRVREGEGRPCPPAACRGRVRYPARPCPPAACRDRARQPRGDSRPQRASRLYPMGPDGPQRGRVWPQGSEVGDQARKSEQRAGHLIVRSHVDVMRKSFLSHDNRAGVKVETAFSWDLDGVGLMGLELGQMCYRRFIHSL